MNGNLSYGEHRKLGNMTGTGNGNVRLILLVAVFIFFLTDTARSILINDQFSYYNFPFLLAGTVFLIRAAVRNSVNYGILYVVFAFSVILYTYSYLFTNYTLAVILQTVISVTLPLFLIGVKVPKPELMQALRIVILLFNALIFLLLGVGVADFLTGGSIQLLMANTIYNGLELGDLIRVERALGIYRYYSFVGHPLANAHYFLVFFILNHIYAKHDRFLLKKMAVTFMTMLGLLLSGSKTGLVLGLFLVIFCSGMKRNRVFYFAGIIAIIVVLFNTPLFEENIKQRFLGGIQSGDITSGRNELLQTLANSRADRPGLLLGGGAGYSREVAKSLNGNIFNFEYPLIMLAYDYGIAGTAIIYFLILIYPVYVLIRNKSYYELVLFIVLSALANSNNGLANLGSDALAQLCFTFFIFRNLGKHEKASDPEGRRKRWNDGKSGIYGERGHSLLQQ
ncbi:hypothetical protein [Paenibacillus sp. DMB20]|uniref:hypothetical protein n=1 Tax=Paenibacillus sp. DMB20 TaxID=1642570 RepID=UPI0006278AD0|nr:hypothetical protein [Paenibacillus sp. DMB20]KKO51013.1 hypothetical protein XI25_28790 [Paenibacillus sp. DMB20]